MPRSLPAQPNLRFLQKEAKSLLKAHHKGDPACCETLGLLHQFSGKVPAEILAAPVALSEAQLALALSYGFGSWLELRQRAEGNVGLLRAMVRDMNRMSDVDKMLARYCAPDYIVHADGRDIELPETRVYWSCVRNLALACGGARARVDQVRAEGDRVHFRLELAVGKWTRWLPGRMAAACRGTAQAEIRCENGRVVEAWVHEGQLPAAPDLSTPAGQVQLASLLRAQGQHERALKLTREAAAQGNPEALRLLGDMARQGQGQSRDLARAADCYQQAADLGSARGQRGLQELRLLAAVGADEAEAGVMHAIQPLPGEPKETEPIVRLVDLILSEAVKNNASAVEIEPLSDRLRVGFRIDGEMREVDSPPARLAAAVAERLKEMLGIELAARDYPLSGRCQLGVGDQAYRVSGTIAGNHARGQRRTLAVLELHAVAPALHVQAL